MSESTEVTDRPGTAAELADLIESLTVFDYTDGGEGYEKSADAIWQASLAAFNYVARKVGATGFQASWAALRFYGEALSIDGPFTVVQVHDALYPQYDVVGRVERFIEECRPWLAEQAAEKLAGDTTYAAASVVDHWRNLATPTPGHLAGTNRTEET